MLGSEGSSPWSGTFGFSPLMCHTDLRYVSRALLWDKKVINLIYLPKKYYIYICSQMRRRMKADLSAFDGCKNGLK